MVAGSSTEWRWPEVSRKLHHLPGGGSHPATCLFQTAISLPGMSRRIAAVAAVGALLAAGLMWWRNREPETPEPFGTWTPLQ